MKRYIIIFLLCINSLYAIQHPSFFKEAPEVQEYILQKQDLNYYDQQYLPIIRKMTNHPVSIGYIKVPGGYKKVIRKHGITEFVWNVFLYVLEIYFIRKGFYRYRHIPKPISIDFGKGVHYRQYVSGREGRVKSNKNGAVCAFPLEITKVISKFREHGILFKDINYNMNDSCGLHNVVLNFIAVSGQWSSST